MCSGIVPLEDATNHDKIKVIDVNECKNCKHHYKSLLKHLGQRKPCYDSYSKQEKRSVKYELSPSHKTYLEKISLNFASGDI